MISFRAGNHRSLALSLLIHALLLVMLTMYIIKPMQAPRWYEFELAPPELHPDAVVTTPGPGASQPLIQTETGKPTTTKPNQTKPQTSQPEKPAVASEQPQTPARSELLETPAITTTIPAKPTALPNNPLNPLRGIPTNRPGSTAPGGSVNYSLGGGGVRFQLPDDYKHNLGAAGRVVITFRLDQNARPIMSSVESSEQSGPRYFDAAKKMLQDGKFSYTGSPNPGREYSLTINFL
ncbi:MAG TPA: hypothetical protein P5170_01590 [Candidatus Syntrophosphaera sp.]|nr:hypothetical protein [Candidatus Syntrophosphaera sp.]